MSSRIITSSSSSATLFLLIVLLCIINILFVSADTLTVITYQNSTNCSSTIRSSQVFQVGSCIDFFSSTGTKYRVQIVCNGTYSNMRLYESITGDDTDCERTPLQTLLREQSKCFLGETTGTSTTMFCSAGKLLGGGLLFFFLMIVIIFLLVF